jgi:hypothetical protein
LSTGRCGQGSGADEGEQLAVPARSIDAEAIARQGLAARDVAQLEGEALERRKARRLGMKMPEIEPPACRLFAGVLAHEAVKPALQATRQREICAVDRQHERVVKDGAIEPVRHDEIDTGGVAVCVRVLGPLVDPGEAVHAPLARLAQRGGDRGGLQAVEGGLQAMIVARAGAAADERQNLVGCSGH